MRRSLSILLVLGSVFSWSATANAADIATTLGTPGVEPWNTICGTDAVEPPDLSGLECDPFVSPLCLHRVDIEPSNFPNAVCSDGTPGAFYIRPGIGAGSDKWVIHLQGGAGCNDYASCLERWCGWEFYTAGTMSTDWTADGISDLPLTFSPLGHQRFFSNDFGDWNHVFLYYCSSDAWMGRAGEVTLSDGVDQFTVDARGHTILSAVRRMLRKNNADPNWTSEDGDATLPDLDDATEILFTGTSAGGWGAVENADWFLGLFGDARSALVVDGALDIEASVMDAWGVEVDTTGDGFGDTPYSLHLADHYRDQWASGGYLAQIDAFVDESCRAIEEPLGSMDACTLPSRLLTGSDGATPYVGTPTFVRHDLEDGVISQRYTAEETPEGDSLFYAGTSDPITLDDYTAMMRWTVRDLYLDQSPVTGAYAPRCGEHVGLELARPFFTVTTPDTILTLVGWVLTWAVVPGTSATFHDTLSAWFDSGGAAVVPIRRIDSPEAGGSFSGC